MARPGGRWRFSAGVENRSSGVPFSPASPVCSACLTKPITALSVARLAVEGRIHLDRPVREYLPFFRLLDPAASRVASLRDLLAHRTGLAAHFLAWHGRRCSRAGLINRLRFLEPSAGFRERFQYCSLGYVAAGCALGSACGSSWEAEVTRSVLQPLGMEASRVPRLQGAVAAWPVGYVHRRFGDDRVSRRPEGGNNWVSSTLGDLSCFAQYCARPERLGSVGERSVAIMMTPHVPVKEPSRFPELGPLSYGLGFFLRRYRGYQMAEARGNMCGFSSHLCILPELRLSAVAVANMEGSGLPRFVCYSAIDAELEVQSSPWLARLCQAKSPRARAGPKSVHAVARSSVPSLRPYLGAYSSPAYGPLRVLALRGCLKLRFRGELWSLDSTPGGLEIPGDQPIPVRPVSSGGCVKSLAIRFEPDAPSYIQFRRLHGR
ncbi:MAG: serine hydrolase domain-containing protein [Terriglobales bacterium]